MDSIIKYFEESQEKYFTALSNGNYFLSRNYYLVFGIIVITDENKEKDYSNYIEKSFENEISIDDFTRDLDLYKPETFKSCLLNNSKSFPIEVKIEKFHSRTKQEEILGE